MLDSVYETLLATELERAGVMVDRQKPIDIVYNGIAFPRAFVADLLLDGSLLIEVKSVERTPTTFSGFISSRLAKPESFSFRARLLH